MYREVRRDLIMAIDRADMDRSGTRKMFMQRGYREFFGEDYPQRESPKDLIIDFIRYFCFDGSDEAEFNGFQGPWAVILARCRPNYHIRIRDERRFCDGLKQLVCERGTRWPAYADLLERELIQADGR